MKTVVISIDELSKRPKGYQVRLHLDDGSVDWMEKNRALASTVIPEDLRVDDPPLDPVENQPLQGEKLREIFLQETDTSRRLEPIGEYLYKLLFRGDVGTEWDRLRALYPEEDEGKEGRRTILDIKPQALRLLPWELLFDGRLPLSLNPRNPVIRGRLDTVMPQNCYQWPLHVLIVIGASEEESKEIEAYEEVAEIEAALIKLDEPVEWDVIKRPTNQELVDKLRKFRPHIFHFIGHGRKASGNDAPVLAFEAGEAGGAWEWTARKIIIDLQGWKPRFAFINACRSSDEQESKHVSGITEAFVDAGVPAVLGMQADVQGKAASKFPGELYQSLARDKALDVALAEARAIVSRIEDDGLQRREWSLATFFLSIAPERVLDMKPRATVEFRSTVNNQFANIKDFVDRIEPRRKLWEGIEPLPSAVEAKRLLIVRGIAETGKTWLVQWCLRGCTWRERNITYVSLKQMLKSKGRMEEGAKNLVDVLRLIITGGQAHPFGRPLPPSAFYYFNAVLNNLLDPAEPAPARTGPGSPVEDKGLPFREDIDHDSIETILRAFRMSLQEASQNQPLIIALDDVTKGEVRKDHFRNYLMPSLIQPIAQGREESLKNVKMILAVKEDDYEELGLREVENLSINIPLGALTKTDLDFFLRSLCILRAVPPEKFGKFYNLITDSSGPVMPGDIRELFTMWTEKFLRLS